MDIARIGIEVSASGAATAARDLGRMDKSMGDVDRRAGRLNKGMSATDRAMAALRRETDLGNRALQDFNRSTHLASRALGLVGVALAGLGLGSVISQIKGFEVGMSRVQAISRSSASEMQRLERVAREMGATTSFSATQASDGMASLAMAGLNTSQIIKALPSTLALARAGALDLGLAASITTNTMKAFKLEASDTGRIVDVLALASNSANTDIQGLGEGFKYAAPWSKALGVSVETTAAALGVLADNGLQASQGGTGLAGVYRQLTKVTSEGEKVLKSYGLTTADVDIKALGFTNVMGTLASKSLSAKDALQLFGSEAGLAANVFLSSTDNLNKLNAEMYNATGAAQAAANAMGNNLSGDLDQLGSAISEVILYVNEGSGLGGHLRALTQITTETIAVMFDFSKVSEDSSEEMKRINAIAKDMAAALGLVKDAAIAVAIIMAGRYLSSIVAATAAKVRLTAASLAGTVQMNAMGVVISRTTWQTNVMAAATNALGGAMRLLGGPVGLITIAASALYIFASRTTQAEKDAKALQGRIDGLAGSFEGLGKRQAEAALVDYIDKGKELARKLQIASGQVEQMNANMMRTPGSKKLGEWNKNLIKFSGAQEDAEKAVAANEAAMKQLKDIINGTNKVIKTNTLETDTNTGSTGSNTDTKVKAAKATKQLSDETKHYNNLIRDGASLNDKHMTSTERVMAAQQRLNEQRAIGAVTERTYRQEMAALNSEMDYTVFQTEKIAEQSTVFTRAWENAIDRIDGTFIDLFKSAFTGFKDFTQSIKNTFKNLLAELAYMAVKNRIMISLGMVGPGSANAAGIPGMGGGMGDIFSLAKLGGTISKAWGAIQSGWGAISSGYATGGFSGAASAGGNFISGMFGGGGSAAAGVGTSLGGAIGGGSAVSGGLATAPVGAMGTAGWGAGGAGTGASAGAGAGALGAVAGVAAAAAGGYFVGKIAGGHGDIGGAIGGGLGMAIGGPIGGAIGAALGSVIGGAFGGKYQEYINETRLSAGGDAGGQVSGYKYREEKRKRLWKTDYKRYYDPLDSSLNSGLNSGYDDIVDTVQDLFSGIGVNVSESVLRGVRQAGLTIQGGTSAEQAQQMVSGWMNQMAETMVGAVDGSLSVGRLRELVTSLHSANPVLDAIGVRMMATSKHGALMAERLIAVSGGLQSLTEKATFYYDNMYTNQEKLERLQNSLSDSMSALGYSVPATREGFRAIVESLDLTQAHSQGTFNALLNLAPMFDQVATAAEQAADRLKQEAAELLAQRKNAVGERFNAYLSQSQRLQLELMKLTGDEAGVLAMQRQAELEAMDESLRPFQERVWALQDEQRAMVETIQAQQQFANSLEQVRQQLGGAFSSIDAWLDNLKAGGSPEQALGASKTQYEAQLALAKGGDFSALQSLTQYADRYLNAVGGMFASGPESQRIQQEIIKAMEGLKAISPYEFLAQEFKDAITSQGAISDDELRKIVESVDKAGGTTADIMDKVREATGGVQDATDKVDGNTSQLEDEAKKQLAALKINTDEMIRQTGQFVEINGTMSSLKDAILALTNLQAEQAAIEAREKAMKERDKLVFEKQRQQEGIRAKAQSSIDRVLDLANQHGVKLQGKGGGNASFDVGANGVDIDYQGIWGPNIGAINAFKNAANQLLIDDVYGGNSALAKLAKEIAALESQKFATGGAFTNGIVSRATSFPMGMMGEAGPEAIMPLANVGGSLGVRVASSGGGDNGEQLTELRKQNQMLQSTIQVLQAGFNKLIEKADEGNDSLDDINRNSRLNGRIA